MPNFSHGFVRLSALSASLASSRPPRFELVGPLGSTAGFSPSCLLTGTIWHDLAQIASPYFYDAQQVDGNSARLEPDRF
jgi:hypothetical protein